MATPTRYVRSSLEIVTSEDSSYLPEKYKSRVDSNLVSDSEESPFDFKFTAGTGGSTLALTASYGSIKQMWVENLDSTNFCTLAFTSTAGTCSLVLNAGDFMKVPNVAVTASLTATANTANVVLRFILVAELTEV